MYSNPAYDSFRLKIDIHNTPSFKLTEKGFLSFKSTYTLVNNETGEIEEEDFKKHSIHIDELYQQGIKIRMGIIKEATGENSFMGSYEKGGRIEKEYLQIGLNSKILKDDYFKGITKKTIETVYNTLIEQGYFSISFEDFLNSKIVDTDIKSDIYLDESEDLVSILKEFDTLLEGGELHKKKNNKGFQLGYRKKSTNVISKPFIKIYAKSIELEHHTDSKVFADNFLLELPKPSLRLEGTIKNNKHFQSILKALKIERMNPSLGNYLKLSEKDLMNVLRLFLSKYVKHKKSKRLELVEVKDMKLTKEQLIIYKGLKSFIMTGGTVTEWLEDFEDVLTTPTFYRYKDNVHLVYEILKQDEKVSSKIRTTNWINDLLTISL